MTKWICLSIILALTPHQQSSPQSSRRSFVLDPSKPYAYLAFDHRGSHNLWLQIVNNSNETLLVATAGTRDGEPGVFYDVIPVEIRGVVVSNTDEPPNTNDHVVVPRGFSSEVYSESSVYPGKTLLFSVPADAVSPKGFLRVKVALDVGNRARPGPYTELDFFIEDLPSGTK